MKYLLIIVVAACLGCQKKVDCEKLHKKIQSCQNAFDKVFSRSGETKSNEFDNLLKEIVDKRCRARSGKFGDVKTLNKCLGVKECDDFVKCLFRLPAAKSRGMEKK
ncbi:hypothetical protein KKF34_06770 [Myxococcota bacterium]|nr:hypothetical protein [Myxococcota bacterium]MBU1382404.1 hypothetical protein [Myxococcota bacterium]MBU1496563.1 hypothetical protein [Myxococcota bacterium]